MNGKIKLERTEKLQKIVDASIEHLRRGLATLEDANLYTNDDQEHCVDVCVNDLEDLLDKIRELLPYTPPAS